MNEKAVRSVDDLAEKSKPNLSRVIAKHYNDQAQKETYEVRQESRIFHMRGFNNWIKTNIINEFIDLAKQDNNARPEDIRIIDIGCGKGGDLKKYLVNNIRYLLCTDISETSLDKAKERYHEMQTETSRHSFHRNRLFDCDFVHADSTRETLRDKLPRPNCRFDLALIQFAYHYSFESIDQALKMLQNASDNLRTGGYFVGTTVDAYRVIDRVRKEKKASFGNDIFSLTFPDEILNEKKKIKLFGATYNFHLDGVVDCPEFLVYFPVVVKLAKKFNLELVYCKNFSEYYVEKFDQQSKSLMIRMKSLTPFPLSERDNARNLSDDQIKHEYRQADEYLRRHPEIIQERRKVGTLSASEWEVISLYIVFAFKKIRQ